MMTPEQRFIFDVQGYIIIPSVLSLERVQRMVADMEGFFNNKATALAGAGGLTPKYKRQAVTVASVWPSPPRILATKASLALGLLN